LRLRPAWILRPTSPNCSVSQRSTSECYQCVQGRVDLPEILGIEQTGGDQRSGVSFGDGRILLQQAHVDVDARGELHHRLVGTGGEAPAPNDSFGHGFG
jgi:hypothetical protein